MRQYFILAYIHVAIPYRTAKFKPANIFATAIWGPTAKFNSRQYFRLYGTCFHVHDIIIGNTFDFDCRFGPYFVEPVVAGLDPKTDEPYIATMDLIGCPMETKDFVVGGTCSEQLYGMCESLWNPDMVSATQHKYKDTVLLIGACPP